MIVHDPKLFTVDHHNAFNQNTLKASKGTESVLNMK